MKINENQYCSECECFSCRTQSKQRANDQYYDSLVNKWAWNMTPFEAAHTIVENDYQPQDIRDAMHRMGFNNQDIGSVLRLVEDLKQTKI